MSQAQSKNSQPVAEPPPPPPLASHPTFGVASGGQDGARRAEEVRQITGKTFHLLLRCWPTGEERCVAGSTSALPRRQQAREKPEGRAGAREGGGGSLSAAQGAMTASLLAGSGGTARCPGSKRCADRLPCRQFTPGIPVLE